MTKSGREIVEILQGVRPHGNGLVGCAAGRVRCEDGRPVRGDPQGRRGPAGEDEQAAADRRVHAEGRGDGRPDQRARSGQTSRTAS